ncbi:MAG: hypothetical protein LUH03_02055 [Oscillospiraceae bacterium]|nr:hypothetical protein [Oscillospiraceae bacterium]
MKKLLALALSALMVVSLFSGCGANSETGDVTNSTTEEKHDNSNIAEEDAKDEEVIAEEKSVEEKAKEAIESLNVWDGSVAESYAGGNGSIDNPYQIATAEQLAKLSYDTNNGVTFSGVYFELTNDIMLNDISYWDFDDLKANENIGNSWINEWTSIGKFSGSFDGNDYTIYGLCGNCGGLFYSILQVDGCAGIVSNLNCVCSYFNNKEEDSRIGVISRSMGYYATIYNCHVAQSVILNYDNEIGGICGSIDGANISNCSSKNVYISSISAERVGGICGYMSNSAISECCAEVEVVLNSVYLLSYVSKADIGGICGKANIYNGQICYIEKCYSDVNFNINGIETGTTIENNDQAVNIGGLIGESEGTMITNCGSRGVIIYTDNSGDFPINIGGISGCFEIGSKNENSVELSLCYSNVSISSDYDGTVSAGIVGLVDNKSIYSNTSIEVTNCIYNNEYSNKGIGDAGSSSFSNNIYGHTEEELKDISNYIDWDFDTIWMVDSSLNDGLPILRSQAKYFQN